MRIFYLIVLSYLILYSTPSVADNKFHINRLYNYIEIDSTTNGFVSSFTINGKIKAHSEVYSIYYTELEEIEDLKVFYTKKGKKIKLNSKQYYQGTLSDASFYSGLHNISFVIPYDEADDNSITITYKIVSNEIYLLTEFKFYSEYNIDTMRYEINVPSNYNFNYSNTDYEKTTGVIVENKKNSNNSYTNVFTKYNIKNINDKKDLSSYINYNYLLESIRYYTIPVDKLDNPFLSFSNWYRSLLQDYKQDISPELEKEFNTIVKNETNSDSIIKHAINYVKLKIRYIAIENGINAFKPRSPAVVINNKKGDCKDMALLLVNILRLKNIEAYVALIPSTYSKYDFNFPSLSSADHAICIAKINNTWRILDATDSDIPFPLTSRHTQGKTALIIKENGYEFYKIPITSAKNNKINMEQNINFTDTGIINNYSYAFQGYCISEFTQLLDENDKNKQKFNVLASLESKTLNMVYLTSNITNYDTLIKIDGSGILKKSLINLSGSKFYISTSFLPNPIYSGYKIDSNEKVLLGESVNIKLVSTINLPTKAKLNNPKKFIYDDYPFYLNISYYQLSDNKLQIKYEYKMDDIIIDFNNFQKYNNLCTELKKALNYVLSIQ